MRYQGAARGVVVVDPSAVKMRFLPLSIRKKHLAGVDSQLENFTAAVVASQIQEVPLFSVDESFTVSQFHN
jgi:hypothetical protein